MFRFALRNAFRRLRIVIAAIMGLGLGCALMTILFAANMGMNEQMNEAMSRMVGNIVIYPPGGASIFGAPGGLLPADWVRKIEEIDHVIAATPRVETSIPVPEEIKEKVPDLPVTSYTLVGIDPAGDEAIGGPTTAIKEGRSIEGDFEVIWGETVWNYLQKRGVELEDVLGKEFSVPLPDGRKVKIKVVGIFDTGNFMYDLGTYATLNTARIMAGIPEGKATQIVVKVDSYKNVREVAEKLKEILPAADVVKAGDLLKEAEKSMRTFERFLIITAVTAAVVGGFSIFIVMFMSVTERRRDFGIMKAVGWADSDIMSLVLMESIIIALAGACFGFGLGSAGCLVANKYLGEAIASPSAKLAGAVVGFGALMGLLGGLYPARKATQVSPIETLRSL